MFQLWEHLLHQNVLVQKILLIISYLSLLHFLIANNSSMTSKQTSHILVNLFCNSLLSQFKMQVHINIST